MKTLFSLKSLVSLLFLTIFLAPLPGRAADSKPFDAMIDKAMAAYNEGDSKKFFADYAASMSAIATDQTFQALYGNMAKGDVGNYISRTPIAAETVMDGDSPLLVYKAKFTKSDSVKLSINFTKENGVFKIMQVTIARM